MKAIQHENVDVRIHALTSLKETLYKNQVWKVKVSVAQLYPTLCNPMDCSLPGSSVHGILQARILDCIAITYSRGFSRPNDQTWSPALQTDGFFTTEPPEKPCVIITDSQRKRVDNVLPEACKSLTWSLSHPFRHHILRALVTREVKSENRRALSHF